MLSYRHGFHAGSFIDVHKHVALTLLFEHFRARNKPFCFLDTHAGAGLYDLHGKFAQKNREYESGIGRLWGRAGLPRGTARFLEVVSATNGGSNTLRFYPGSPLIGRYFLRPGDRMILVELHNTEAPLLQSAFKGDRQVAVHHRDGFEAIAALVPPPERRGLVLVDPSYEIRDEFQRAGRALVAAWQKWPTGMYVLWYPLQRGRPVRALHRQLAAGGVRRMLLSELVVAPETAPNRLAASALLVVNPPWKFEEKLGRTLDRLASLLEQGPHPPPRLRWLAGE